MKKVAVKRPRGRPPIPDGPQVVLSGRVPKELAERVDQWAERNLKSKSEAVAILIGLGLDATKKVAKKRK